MKFTTELPVRFGEIDQAGVVYYPRFFHYFHQAFEEWFRQALGTSYPDLLLKEGIGFPSVRVESEFLKPLRYGDRARVQIEVLEIGLASLTLRYELFRMPDDILSARATIKTVAIENSSFTTVPIPDAWRQRLERFRATV
jgi:4-hydroxybenzoyl-CoA thioesterase